MKLAKTNFFKSAITEGATQEEREKEICLITKVFRLLEMGALVGGMQEVWSVIQSKKIRMPKGGHDESRF